MRIWFIVGANLLGIYFLADALVALTLVFANPDSSSQGPSGYLATYCCIRFTVGTILTFFTDGVATLVRIPRSHDVGPVAAPRTIMAVGLILIGVYGFMSRVPQAIRAFLMYLEPGVVLGVRTEGVGGDLIVMALWLVLIFRARAIAGLFLRANQFPPEDIESR